MSQGLNNDMAVSKSRRIVKNLRWWMLVLFLLGVTVNYITRNSLGIIAPELKTSLGITTEQYSWIVGAFQLAYTIFQPLCGWLIDVIGLKLGFMICATLWAIACIAHAGAGSRTVANVRPESSRERRGEIFIVRILAARPRLPPARSEGLPATRPRLARGEA